MNTSSIEVLLNKYARRGGPQAEASMFHQLRRKEVVDTNIGRFSPKALGFKTPREALVAWARKGQPQDVAAIVLGTQTPYDEAISAMSRALWIAAVNGYKEGALNYQQSGSTLGHLKHATEYMCDWVAFQRSRIQRQEKKREFMGAVRELRLTDLTESHLLEEILSHWVVDPRTKTTSTAEVARFLQAMTESVIGQNDRHYFVAETTWRQIAGTIGIKPVSEILIPHAATGCPGEIINVYSDPYYYKRGVGGRLLAHAEKVLLSKGYTEAMLISSERFREAWRVYEHLGYSLSAIYDGLYNNQRGSHIYGKVLK